MEKSVQLYACSFCAPFHRNKSRAQKNENKVIPQILPGLVLKEETKNLYKLEKYWKNY